MRVLGEFHSTIGGLVRRFEATASFPEGDGVQLFFNDPIEVPDAALRAVRLACALRVEMAELTPRWRRRGYDLDFGVGIALGYATCGEVGFEGRSDYAAIGAVTNLASRLADEATGGPGLDRAASLRGGRGHCRSGAGRRVHPKRLPTAGRGLQRRRSSRDGSRADNRRERMNAYRTCAPGCHPEDAAEPTGWRARASSHTAVRAASAAVPASVAG